MMNLVDLHKIFKISSFEPVINLAILNTKTVIFTEMKKKT